MLEQEIQQLKNLVKQNLELTHDLELQMRKVKNYLFWMKFWSWVKLILILIPIALALIYLPPIVRRAVEEYYGVIGGLPNGVLESLGK